MCTPCDAGKFGATDGLQLRTQCELCAIGKYSNASAIFCTTCGNGTAQNEFGQSSCEQCLSGQYSPKASTGYATCGLCPAGRTSIQPIADPSSFALSADGSGDSVCTLCPDGKSSSEGDDSCYKIADTFDICEPYDTPAGAAKKVKNECTYLYAGHWETKEETQASPFGAGSSSSCKSYSVCGSEHQKDSTDSTKRDEYFVVCDECADGYEPAAYVGDLLTGWDNELNALNDVSKNSKMSVELCATTKPTVCYKKQNLHQCIDTADASAISNPVAQIECEYYYQGGWISNEPGAASPFGESCTNYTICR